MKTGKRILNDDGTPMSKAQAMTAAKAFICDYVLEAWDADMASAELNFGGTVDDEGEITLCCLLQLATQ